MDRVKKKNLLLLHFIVVLFGFTGIFGKLIQLQALSLVWWRIGFAFAGMLVWIAITRKGLRPSGINLLKYAGIGVIICLHWLAFFHAIKCSNVSVTLAIFSSGALFTSLLEPLLYRRKIKTYEVVLGALVIAGLMMIFSFETKYLEGILFALLAAFLAALFTVLNGLMVSHDRPIRISFYEMLSGFVFLSLFVWLSGSYKTVNFMPSMADFVWLLILGLVCTAFAFVTSVEVMKVLKPFTVSLTTNLEPVYSIILALLIFGQSEKMSVGFYFGTIIIFVTLFLNSLLSRPHGNWKKVIRAFFFWN